MVYWFDSVFHVIGDDIIYDLFHSGVSLRKVYIFHEKELYLAGSKGCLIKTQIETSY